MIRFFQVIGRILELFGLRFLQGVGVTIGLSAIAVAGGVVLGTFLTLLYRSRFRILRWLARGYIELLRGTPLLLQLFFFFYGIEALLGVDLGKFVAISLALVVNSSAYVSEIIRSGIQAVDRGQSEAARSLGLNSRQTMSRIILPQAVRNILPALGNEFIMIIKETSLASTYFLGEIMSVQATAQGATYRIIEPMIIAAVLYLVLTTVMSKLVGLMERRLGRSD